MNHQTQAVRRLLNNERARMACPNGAKASSTPVDRLYNLLVEENLPAPVMADLQLLLESTQEKRRLTIDWRGAMMSHSDLIKQTARRVGLVAPELPNSQPK